MLPLGALTVALTSRLRTSSRVMPHGGELVGLGLHPHSALLLAADHHLRHAGDLRDLLRQHVLGVVVGLDQRQRIGLRRQDHDRRVGRVHLPVGRRPRHDLRQLPAGGLDRRLDVAGRAIDVAIEVELHRHARAAQDAHRGELRHPGDLRDLGLQRLRHRRRHSLRACAGKTAAHHDRGEIDTRQRRDWQQRIGGDPHQHQRRHHQ